jgi:hypothetical protein
MRPMPLSDGSSPGGLSRSAGHWSVIAWLVGALLVAVGATSLAIYAGAYDVAANQPHPSGGVLGRETLPMTSSERSSLANLP